MHDPLYEIDARYAALDEPALLVMFEQLSAGAADHDALGPVVRQLVLRAVPVIQRTVREFGAPRGLAEQDFALIEDEALTKLMLRLGRCTRLRSLRVLAYELARECAEDPQRRPAPALAPPRPSLHLVRSRGPRRGGDHG